MDDQEIIYDAWGNLLSTTGPLKDSLGLYNPLRYRGYVYDQETGLYYLQSRYYDPEIGRFINSDAFAATGQGLLGNNMFAYCNNNPIMLVDPCGTCIHRWDFWNDCANCKDKGSMEKIYDFSLSLLKGITKLFKTTEAAVESVDVYAGVGLGFLGEADIVEGLEISGGMGADFIGVRVNDGEVEMNQRFYSGIELSVGEPIIDFSEEMYRKFTFSGTLPEFTDIGTDNSITIFSTSAYLGIGGTIRIAFDLDYFRGKLDETVNLFN